MKIIRMYPGPDDQGRCCHAKVALCEDCPKRMARRSDPETSHDAAEHMAKGLGKVEEEKILMVYYKTGKELNPWEMMCQSEGTVGPDTCYWRRCTDLRRKKEIELVTDRLGKVVTRPGSSTRNQRVYRITAHGEAVAKVLILGV